MLEKLIKEAEEEIKKEHERLTASEAELLKMKKAFESDLEVLRDKMKRLQVLKEAHEVVSQTASNPDKE